MSDSTLILPDCRHLILAGLPGSGKKTLQQRLCGILETDGIPWSALSAFDFHTAHAKSEIRKGNLLRSAPYWVKFFADLDGKLRLLEKCSVHLVLTGTFLTKDLRRHAVDLGRREGDLSDVYIVWLGATEEIAQTRLLNLQESDHGGSFKPEWLERYREATQVPQTIEKRTSSRKLLRTDEENVFLLDADNDQLGHKVNSICNGVTGLKKARVRMEPQ